MKKAIAIVEFSTVSTGINAADTMTKAAHIEIVEAGSVCSGKYLIVIAGLLSAVSTSLEAAKTSFGERCINGYVLGNPHESILSALYGTSKVENIRALGVFETFDTATAVVAADSAVKTAIVDLIEIRLAKGMCGKSYVTLTGEVSAVEAAVAKAVAVAKKAGMHLDSCVIANPDEKLAGFIL